MKRKTITIILAIVQALLLLYGILLLNSGAFWSGLFHVIINPIGLYFNLKTLFNFRVVLKKEDLKDWLILIGLCFILASAFAYGIGRKLEKNRALPAARALTLAA